MTLPPLLLLAEGRKPRPRKAPAERSREYRLHADIVSLLDDHCLPSWRYFHPANGERRDARAGARLKRLGVKPGVPDLVLIGPDGQARFIEFKATNGDLSEPQARFREWCIRSGIAHVTAFTFDQALTALNAWGCLRVRIGGAG